MVSIKKGMEIMNEVEEAQRRRAKIRAILACGMLAEDSEEKKSAELKSMFPEVPDHLLERIVGTEHWDGHRLPFNRRMRRRIDKATSVVVHLFSGADPGRWVRWEKEGTAVVCLDALQGADLHDEHLSGWLDELVESGKVTMWLAGPPCRSVSVCRQREDNGPRTLRERQGAQRFGIPGLTEQEMTLADGDAVLWLKNLRWIRKAKARNAQLQVMVEQPRDPMEWKELRPGQAEHPSFLVWPETGTLSNGSTCSASGWIRGVSGMRPESRPHC